MGTRGVWPQGAHCPPCLCCTYHFCSSPHFVIESLSRINADGILKFIKHFKIKFIGSRPLNIGFMALISELRKLKVEAAGGLRAVTNWFVAETSLKRVLPTPS